MSPSSPERTKVTKQQTISLKMQLFCWLWVLDLSPAKAVARCYLAFFIFFQSIAKRKQCLVYLDYWTSFLLVPNFCPCFSHPFQFILQEQPKWSLEKTSESSTPNSTVLTLKWDQYCADLINYPLNTPQPTKASTVSLLFLENTRWSLVLGHLQQRLLCWNHFLIDITAFKIVRISTSQRDLLQPGYNRSKFFFLLYLQHLSS